MSAKRVKGKKTALVRQPARRTRIRSFLACAYPAATSSWADKQHEACSQLRGQHGSLTRT